MGVLNNSLAYRDAMFGPNVASKDTGTLAATTVGLFTVAGGRVIVTHMYGLVTVSITVANSYKLQIHPTVGDTTDLCTATDIGTTDSVAGSTLGFGQGTTAAPALIKGGWWHGSIIVPVGAIEHVSAGTDGKITWYVRWVPYDTGATLVAQ